MFWLQEIGSNHETTKTSKQKGALPLTRRRLKSLGWEQGSETNRGWGGKPLNLLLVFPGL